MKMCFRVILLAAFIVGVSATAFAADKVLKIASFDLNGAAIESQWGKKVTEDLKKEQARLAGDLDEKGKAFKAAKDDFDKKRDVMDEKNKVKKQKELQDMATDLEKQASESSAKLQQTANQLKKPLFDKIHEIVTKIGKDDKYDFIIEKTSLHFIGSDANDLTKRVSAELDKSAPPK
jgi:outer membrane protein